MSEKLLRHVVLMGFKDTTMPQQIQEVERTFAGLPARINVIHGFEWGTDVSVENLAQGYTHCFLVTFRSEAHRDTYLPHPAHQELTELVGPLLERVLVIDYWAG